MKKLRLIAKWTIQTILLVYIVIIVLLHLPAVQRVVGTSVAKAISAKLGTKVRIERVDLGFLNRIVIDNIVIYDQHNHQMLSTARLAAQVDIIPLIKTGSVFISSAQLFGLHAVLNKPNANAPANYQFVLDSLASKDKTTKSKLDLAINSLVIRNGFLKYDQLDAPKQVGQFTPKHLQLENLSGHIVLDHVTNDMINADVKSLSLKEKSGFTLDKLRFHLFANKQCAELSQLELVTPNSKLIGAKANARYRFVNGKLDRSTLNANVEIKNANILASDFQAIAPVLKKLNKKIRLSLTSQYKGNKIDISLFQLSSADKSLLVKTKGNVDLSTHVPTIHFKADPIKINTETLTLIDRLFGLKLPKQVMNLGDIYYRGTIHTAQHFVAVKGNLRSGAGQAKIDLNLRRKALRLVLHTPSINMGQITGNPKLGSVSADIQLAGTTDLKTMNVDANIPLFDYNHYSYKNLFIKGLYMNDRFEGKASLHDPNGAFSFDGMIANIRQFFAKKNKLVVDAKVVATHLNLANLQLTDALGHRTMSFESSLKGSASSFDDIDGFLEMSNVSVVGEGKNFAMNGLRVKSYNGILNKSLDVESDFGDAHISGLYDFSTLVQSFKNVVHTYLPSLARNGFGYLPVNKHNNFVFDVQINSCEALKDYINIPLKLNSPLVINGRLNEKARILDLFFMSRDAVYAGNQIKNIELTIATKNNSLVTTIDGEYNNVKGQHIYINSLADISNDKIASSINYFAPGHTALKGKVNSDISFYNKRGYLATRVHFHPSDVSIDTVRLMLQPSDIEYYRKNLIIDHFEISNKTQHIIVNGKTSGNPEDSLIVQLKDIDVPYILDLVNFHSVDFGGLASGTASVKSVFSHPIAKANLVVKDFTFQDGDMGELTANAYYENKEGIIYIDAKAFADDNSYTDVKGYVDLKNSYINLPIYAHNTKLYFMQSFCDSFMDRINGSATGWCKVVGPLDEVNLEGDLRANGNMYIKPIGTTYTLENCHVTMLPNEIIFDKDTIRDAKGNIGIVKGGLKHENLKNLTYNVNIAANNLLCYNFPRQVAKESFWGVVFGTGTCNITGGAGETTLDVNLSPEPNTHIIYNAAQTASLEENKFIRWKNVQRDSVLVPEIKPDSLNKEIITTLPSKDVVFHDFNTVSDLRMNFLFNCNPNLTLEVIMDEVSHDNILLNGYGGIRATYYNKGAFQMYGNLFLDHGLYNLTIQNAIKKTFVFQPSSTIAFGGDPFNAALNLQGVYSLSSVPLSDLQLGQSFSTNNTKVNCLLDIKGTPSAPSVSFGIDLPNLSNDAQQMVHSLLNSEEDLHQQALYLLAVGRFYPQVSNNAQQTDAAQHHTSLAMQSLLSGTLSQQINTVLSNVIKSNNWNFGANIATGNEGFSNAEYEGIFSGSLLNNRLLFNGEVGYRDNVATDNSSFIGDFDLRYLLLKNGNVALHFYNKTNDRYFTRNSLTTQGLGIILKKDFTNLRDLFSTRKKKNKKTKQNH